MPKFMNVVVLIPVLLLCSVYIESRVTGDGFGNKTLYLLALGPYPDTSPGYDGGPALIPAVRLAIKHINERDDVLQEYHLNAIEEDSGCADTASLMTIVSVVRHVIHSERPVMGTIGPACSESSTRLAPLGARKELNLIQIAATAVSPALNDETFVNTFRPLGSALAYINIVVQLIEQNTWRQIAALYEDESRDLFQSIFQGFCKAIRERTQAEIVYQSAMYEQFLPVEEIRDHQVRIIFVFAGRTFVSKLLCLAYRFDLVYPKYQWIFQHRNHSHFVPMEFIYNGVQYNCTEEDMNIATNGIIVNTYNLVRQDVDTKDTVAGISYVQYRDEYSVLFKEHAEELVNRSVVSNINSAIEMYGSDEFANMYYDSVWALALGLNHSLPLLSENGLEDLTNYSYGMDNATQIIRDQLLNIEPFEGMSGTIAFNKINRDGSRTIINSFQVHYNESTRKSYVERIGSYDSSANDSSMLNGSFIQDRYDKQIVSADWALIVLMVAFVCLLFVATIFLQVINFWYAEIHKPLKASSPGLTHLIFSGCYLFLLSSGLFAVFQGRSFGLSMTWRVVHSINCSLYAWAFSMGCSLIFGTVCGKAWRLYRIFIHFNRPGHLISDPILISFVICLLLGDFVINLTWNLINPWRLNEEEVFNGNDTINVYITCTCDNLGLWLVILFGYKGVFTIIALVLSVLTRRVHKKNFKNSRCTKLFIHSLILLYGVALPVLLFSRQDPSQSGFYLFLSIQYATLITTVLLCLGCLFLPPVRSLLHQKFTSLAKLCFHMHMSHM